MKSILGVLLIGGFFVGFAVGQERARPEPPEVLALSDLVNRPDRWPATVELAQDFDFQSGRSAKKGQAVRILELTGAGLVVDAGDDLVFQIAAADCNVLAAANAAWKLLTPAQRAVDAQSLLADASLWPVKATCFAGFQLNDGQIIEAGGEFDLLGIDREGVHLFWPTPRTNLVTDLAETDIIVRARALALLEPEKRPSRIAAALKAKMVDATGKPFSSPAIDAAEVYVLYYSASWCQPCRKFTPGFVEYIKEVGPANPKLAVILMSNDKEDADLLTYMQDDDMPWPAVPLATLNESPILLANVGSGIPQLVVLDRHGKVLANSYRNGQNLGPDFALTTLKQLVESGATK